MHPVHRSKGLFVELTKSLIFIASDLERQRDAERKQTEDLERRNRERRENEQREYVHSCLLA